MAHWRLPVHALSFLLALIFVLSTAPAFADIITPRCFFLFQPRGELTPLPFKNFSFPTIPTESANAIRYDRAVPEWSKKDQCAGGCSYNSVANYLEAMVAYARDGRIDSSNRISISANAIYAEGLLDLFEGAILGQVSYISPGGFPEMQLKAILRKGAVLESDFPSHSFANLDGIIEALNHEILDFRNRGGFSRERLDQAIELARRLLAGGMGHPIAIERRVELPQLRERKIITYDLWRMARFETGVTPQASEPRRFRGVKATAEAGLEEMRSQIDRGLPVIITYSHAPAALDRNGIYHFPHPRELDISGHVVLVVGYRLDANGQIDMLKIKNSHANAPDLHMNAAYFSRHGMELKFLQMQEIP